MYLEATITFWEDQLTPEGKDIRKKENHHVLCHCVSYGECEALATVHGLEITTESFEVGPIVEVKLSKIYPNKENENWPWFKCVCTYSEFMENGRERERKCYILVQEENSSTASIKATEFTKDWFDLKTVKTSKVSETSIQAILEKC